ncbi:MAG TPA: RNA polymerase sigma-54 factor [Verrucomicrobia bacterium]|nr:RNA polymerase sigma-54 factor [Verrucomicrobiota bacterium]
MNLNLNLSGSVSQQQQLNLAPQLLQWLRLLQVPAQSLDQLVRTELETNPALEIDESVAESDIDDVAESHDDVVIEAAVDADESGDWPELTERYDLLAELDTQWAEEHSVVSSIDMAQAQDRKDFQMQSLPSTMSLAESVLKQIAMMRELTAEEKACACLIAGSLDVRGYLDVSLDSLAEESGLALASLESALLAIQECEPAGVGARDLNECLLLQLSPSDPSHTVARRIIAEFIEALAQRRFESIARQMGVPLNEVEAAVRLIRSLNPNPGAGAGVPEVTQEVVPDITIRLNSEGGFEIEMVEQSLPRLRISQYCRQMIERGDLSKDDIAYVRSRIRAASFLIEGLEKRGSTLRRIAEEIIRVQFRYLRGEETEARPLTMAKVASFIGVHDTTVSRALADKYVATPLGILPMKQFFCAGYRCDDGSALTPEMVRRRIEVIIGAESPVKPIKDEDIAAQLQEDGIPVARRTVAKYRIELGIPSSKERALSSKGLRVIHGNGDGDADLRAVAVG